MKKKHKFSGFILVLCLCFACNDSPNVKQTPDLSDTDFIYLQGNDFQLRGEKFFSLMLNYIVSFRDVDGSFALSPHIDYENVGVYEANTKEALEEQLSGHFQLIRELGFNTVRLCFDRISKDEKAYFYYADGKKYFIGDDYEKILNGLERAINIAGEKDLRVILLIKNPAEDPALEQFAVRLLQKFHDNPIIFAYDFFNEPLYFDKPPRSKTDACSIVSHWKDLMATHAPNQLLTIGFSEPIETFKWDPALLPVDFVAFHTYHPLRVKNEIYWYSTYVGKPWMIGETALPADGDSISYQEQAAFMREVYQYVVDCGGTGFGWWDFQEATGGNFEAKYTGLLNHEGITTTKDGRHAIIGTVKSAAAEIAHFAEYKPREKIIPVNYYNMVGYNNYLIKGKVLNKKTKTPIEGANIRGWTKSWIGMNTYSNENGEFTLYSNDESIHFEISAPGMEDVKFDKHLEYSPTDDRRYDKEHLPNQFLEYHAISYTPFLKDTATASVFDFDSEKFNQAKFSGVMENVYLQPIKPCR